MVWPEQLDLRDASLKEMMNIGVEMIAVLFFDVLSYLHYSMVAWLAA